MPSDGSIAVAVLVDVLPPFDSGVLPSIGLPLILAYVHATISAEAHDDVSLFFRDDLFLPPVSNIYVVDETTIGVTEFGGGDIEILGAEFFIRSDSDMDEVNDISDPITIIGSLFAGAADFPCERAADANADGVVDISDPIYTIRYLFGNGVPPIDPFPEPGTDFERAQLNCLQPLDP